MSSANKTDRSNLTPRNHSQNNSIQPKKLNSRYHALSNQLPTTLTKKYHKKITKSPSNNNNQTPNCTDKSLTKNQSLDQLDSFKSERHDKKFPTVNYKSNGGNNVRLKVGCFEKNMESSPEILLAKNSARRHSNKKTTDGGLYNLGLSTTKGSQQLESNPSKLCKSIGFQPQSGIAQKNLSTERSSVTGGLCVPQTVSRTQRNLTGKSYENLPMPAGSKNLVGNRLKGLNQDPQKKSSKIENFSTIKLFSDPKVTNALQTAPHHHLSSRNKLREKPSIFGGLVPMTVTDNPTIPTLRSNHNLNNSSQSNTQDQNLNTIGMGVFQKNKKTITESQNSVTNKRDNSQLNDVMKNKSKQEILKSMNKKNNINSKFKYLDIQLKKKEEEERDVLQQGIKKYKRVIMILIGKLQERVRKRKEEEGQISLHNKRVSTDLKNSKHKAKKAHKNLVGQDQGQITEEDEDNMEDVANESLGSYKKRARYSKSYGDFVMEKIHMLKSARGEEKKRVKSFTRIKSPNKSKNQIRRHLKPAENEDPLGIKKSLNEESDKTIDLSIKNHQKRDSNHFEGNLETNEDYSQKQSSTLNTSKKQIRTGSHRIGGDQINRNTTIIPGKRKKPRESMFERSAFTNKESQLKFESSGDISKEISIGHVMKEEKSLKQVPDAKPLKSLFNDRVDNRRSMTLIENSFPNGQEEKKDYEKNRQDIIEKVNQLKRYEEKESGQPRSLISNVGVSAPKEPFKRKPYGNTIKKTNDKLAMFNPILSGGRERSNSNKNIKSKQSKLNTDRRSSKQIEVSNKTYNKCNYTDAKFYHPPEKIIANPNKYGSEDELDSENSLDEFGDIIIKLLDSPRLRKKRDESNFLSIQKKAMEKEKIMMNRRDKLRHKLLAEAYTGLEQELEHKRKARIYRMNQMFKILRENQALDDAKSLFSNNLIKFVAKTTYENQLFLMDSLGKFSRSSHKLGIKDKDIAELCSEINLCYEKSKTQMRQEDMIRMYNNSLVSPGKKSNETLRYQTLKEEIIKYFFLSAQTLRKQAKAK